MDAVVVQLTYNIDTTRKLANLSIRGESQAELTTSSHFADVNTLQHLHHLRPVHPGCITVPQLALIPGAKRPHCLTVGRQR